MATIKQLEKLGFEGIDASLEISLMEYRLAFRPTKKEDEYQFLYTKDSENFNTSYYSKEEFKNLLGESWVDIDGICSFCDTTKEEIIERFPFSMYDVISYYGTDNVFGSWYGGFSLKEFKPTKF